MRVKDGMGVHILCVVSCLITVLYAVELDVRVTSPVIIQLPSKNVTFPCTYNYDKKAKDTIKWEKGRAERGLKLIEKTSNGKVGSLIGDNYDLQGCSLILKTPSVEDSGIYSVTVETLLDGYSESKSASINATFFKDPGVLSLHAITLSAVASVSVTSGAAQVILPCNYTLENKEETVIIEWRHDQPNGSLLLLTNRRNESGYNKGVKMGLGCSLVILNPQSQASGNYSVSICASNCPERKAMVYLEVVMQDEDICTCTHWFVVIAVVVLLLCVLGYLFYHYIRRKRERGNRGSPHSGDEEITAHQDAAKDLIQRDDPTQLSPPDSRDEPNGITARPDRPAHDVQATTEYILGDEPPVPLEIVSLYEQLSDYIRRLQDKHSPRKAMPDRERLYPPETSDQGDDRDSFIREGSFGLRKRHINSAGILPPAEAGTSGVPARQEPKSQGHVQDSQSITEREPSIGLSLPTNTGVSKGLAPENDGHVQDSQAIAIAESPIAESSPGHSLHLSTADLDEPISSRQSDDGRSTTQPQVAGPFATKSTRDSSRPALNVRATKEQVSAVGPPEFSEIVSWHEQLGDYIRRLQDEYSARKAKPDREALVSPERSVPTGQELEKDGHVQDSQPITEPELSIGPSLPPNTGVPTRQEPKSHGHVQDSQSITEPEPSIGLSLPPNTSVSMGQAPENHGHVQDSEPITKAESSPGHSLHLRTADLDEGDESLRHMQDSQPITKPKSPTGASLPINTADPDKQGDEPLRNVTEEQLDRTSEPIRWHWPPSDMSDSIRDGSGNGRSEDQDDKSLEITDVMSESGIGSSIFGAASVRSSEKSRQLSEDNHEAILSLHAAVRNGDFRMCQSIIKMGCKVDQMENGQTALHLAAQRGYTKVTHLLLKSGAAIDLLSWDGNSALHFAAEKGHKYVIQLLIHAGAWTGLKTSDELSSLHIAAAEGHVDICRQLIVAGCSVNQKNKSGNTPLHIACWRNKHRIGETILPPRDQDRVEGYEAIVYLLLQKGAEKDGLNDKGYAPLHLASMKGSKPSVDHLLKAGVQVDQPSHQGQTGLYFAAQYGHDDVVQLLLDKGADVNHKEEERNTALVIAAREGRRDTVELLINKGADVNQANSYGDKPLHGAAKRGHKGIVERLITAGAQIDIPNKNGFTALISAALVGWGDTLEFLINKGADINHQSTKGYTSLNLAAGRGHTEIVERLLAAGAQIDVRDKEGNTPLHSAARRGRTAVVNLLLQAGAQRDSLNVADKTPLDMVPQNTPGREEIFALLLDTQKPKLSE